MICDQDLCFVFLIRNTKHLKRALINEELIDIRDEENNGSVSVSSESPNANSSETSHSSSDGCMENDHSDIQATQNATSVTTGSRCTVKSIRNRENFIYY